MRSPLTEMQGRVRPVLPWRHVTDDGSPYWVTTILGTNILIQENTEKPGTYYVIRGGSRLTSWSSLTGDLEHSLEEAMLAAESYEATHLDQVIRSLTKRLDDAHDLWMLLEKGTA